MRLIDADRLQFEADRFFRNEDRVLDELTSLICMMPPIEAEPVKHGRWIVHNKGMNNWVECSECGTAGSPQWKRCPVCEAKMDGEQDGKKN